MDLYNHPDCCRWSWHMPARIQFEFGVCPLIPACCSHVRDVYANPFLPTKGSSAGPEVFYALLIMNFIAVPLIVWGLSRFLPTDPALLLGVLLVLLTPCIDYVIVFTHLGRGNAQLILISTPCSLLRRCFFCRFIYGYLWGDKHPGL